MSHRLACLSVLATLLVSDAPAGQRSALAPRAQPPPARGTFEIVSCSLGCVPGTSGITCGTTEIHANEELRVTFNQPVALTSLSNASFQMIEVGTGRTPPATLTLDPQDASTLVYRPQMTFDSAGNPLFGLMDGRVYFLKLPGTDLDPLGPYVTSLGGLPNRTRLQCTLVASLGVVDVVPGRPVVKLTVQVVLERDPVTGEPTRVATVPAEGATEVYRQGPLDMLFADVMNPASIANPVTGQSSFIHVRFDPDGNVQNVSDQVPVPGLFTLTIDTLRSSTRVVFRATGGLPASGPQRQPGRIVVELSPQISDLGGNTLANPGRTTFTTEAR